MLLISQATSDPHFVRRRLDHPFVPPLVTVVPGSRIQPRRDRGRRFPWGKGLPRLQSHVLRAAGENTEEPCNAQFTKHVLHTYYTPHSQLHVRQPAGKRRRYPAMKAHMDAYCTVT